MSEGGGQPSDFARPGSQRIGAQGGTGRHRGTDADQATEVLDSSGAVRFADAPDPPTTRAAATHADLFDDDRPRAWRSRTATVAIAALAVGAVAGGLAMRAYADRAAATSARSELSVSAALTSIDPPTEGTTTIAVTYTNFGDYPVSVGAVAFKEPAFSATPRDPVVSVPPHGKSATQTLAASIDCSLVGPARFDWQPSTDATVTVTTADGAKHEQSISLLGSDRRFGGLAQFAYNACGQAPTSFSELPIYYLGTAIDGDHVVSQIVVGDPSDLVGTVPLSEPPVISLTELDVGSGATAFTVAPAGGLPADLTVGEPYDLVWTVADCDRALQGNIDDMIVTLRGTLNDSVGSVVVSPDIPFTVQLVKFTVMTCGGAVDD